MAYEEKYQRPEQPHNLILEGRGRLMVTGVEDVESFDEGAVVLSTVAGSLTVRGTGLHIDKLSLDGGELALEGEVASLSYGERRGEKTGLWQRLFR